MFNVQRPVGNTSTLPWLYHCSSELVFHDQILLSGIDIQFNCVAQLFGLAVISRALLIEQLSPVPAIVPNFLYHGFWKPLF